MRRLLTPPWIVLHCFAVVLTVAFGLLGWWQLSRAQHGNAISWGYAFEWPLFAVFTLTLWIRQMRLELRKDLPEGATRRGRPEPPPMTSPFESAIVRARENAEPEPHRPAQGSHA
ncbi:hypothetical protein [Glycomyces paridis]|uniref:Uncharacterized protein n=1 Tax=Glycomyces paridis TaxID=2126555 RepID=A0A4S8PD62_9ACTN|nr:hypothetical protein [Glycomyces paridis]THV28307.1 hypothetical protein E9998_11875 [Glycomyces paridis]